MPFVKRFNKIISRANQTNSQLWLRSLALGAILTASAFLYLVCLNAQALDWHTFNQAVANAGMVMIGLSFILSGVCYFWDFFDSKIIYRKHLGLVGFWLIVVHGLTTFSLPSYSFFDFFLPQNIVAFLSAVVALGILIMMALISNKFAARELGGKRWRALLRTGYIAYFFGTVHFFIKKYPLWQDWAAQYQANPTAPPLSLLVLIFVIVVFAMRLSLFSALRYHKYLQKE